MKTDLKAKLLQHYIKKNGNKGFTLIELLVVVIIIGILAAVALPSMLNQASKARLASAKNQAGAINRAQQAYRLENAAFANQTSLEAVIGTQAAPDGYAVPAVTGGTTAKVLLTSNNTDQFDVCGTVTATGGTTNATLAATNNTGSGC
ncbi:MAG: prepilin-type N-terminal cleavage/methylation domain-containing protein [Acaryochloris sp. RU_4_1]|nr:prepilin-type N-terminal cleavage/methylation domain-containing protein [Acaryochloris sp. RU_4_1]